MTNRNGFLIKVSLGQYLELIAFRGSPNYASFAPVQVGNRLTEILGAELVTQMQNAEASGAEVYIEVKEALEHTDEELEGLGYEGLRMLGFTPQQARDVIATRMTEETLNIYRKWNRTPEGQARLNEMASHWRKEGVLPPWYGRL